MPTICSSRPICWLSVGWAMNNRSAARVKVPASATAAKYRKCRSSSPSGTAPDGPSACALRRGADPVSACVILVIFITSFTASGPGPVSQQPPGFTWRTGSQVFVRSVHFDDAAAVPLIASRDSVALAGSLPAHGRRNRQQRRDGGPAVFFPPVPATPQASQFTVLTRRGRKGSAGQAGDCRPGRSYP